MCTSAMFYTFILCTPIIILYMDLKSERAIVHVYIIMVCSFCMGAVYNQTTAFTVKRTTRKTPISLPTAASISTDHIMRPCFPPVIYIGAIIIIHLCSWAMGLSRNYLNDPKVIRTFKSYLADVAHRYVASFVLYTIVKRYICNKI